MCRGIPWRRRDEHRPGHPGFGVARDRTAKLEGPGVIECHRQRRRLAWLREGLHALGISIDENARSWRWAPRLTIAIWIGWPTFASIRFGLNRIFVTTTCTEP